MHVVLIPMEFKGRVGYLIRLPGVLWFLGGSPGYYLNLVGL